MAKKNASGFKNDAADKIWNDHVGNNVFVHHRDQCPNCQDSIKTWRETYQTVEAEIEAWRAGKKNRWCPEGERLFHEMFDETMAKIDEAMENQN